MRKIGLYSNKQILNDFKIPIRYRTYVDKDETEDVHVLCASFMIWRSNADMNCEDEGMGTFAKLGKCLPIIITTQKIAIYRRYTYSSS